MKLATFWFFTVTLLAGPTPQAQNQRLIEPGDVLVVRLVSKWKPPISRIVAVTPDGKLRLPPQPGMQPVEDISVAGLELTDAGQRLAQDYHYYRVVVERGTVDQLLRR
jgi:protein involved in polysaccharide export with SLBB domain